MNTSDIITDFIGFMESEGVRPVEPIAQRLATGALIRFRCEGDGKGKQNGWAILYTDERPAGAFGNYRLGTGTRKWKSGVTSELTPEERASMQREWAAAKQRRDDERDRSAFAAAIDAAEMWQHATPGEHPYLKEKQMSGVGCRVLNGELLVPMFDDAGTLCNLQRIYPDGQKRFLKGGRCEGVFTTIGKFTEPGQTCCVGEGYATMNAVHRATGHPCIVAFNSGNLSRVARIWAERRPDLDFIICADDDAHLATNEGIVKAELAAIEIGARVAYPPQSQAA